MLDVAPSLADYLWFWRRRRIVSAVSSAIIRPVLRRLPAQALSDSLMEARTAFRRLTRRALWDALRNPLADRYTGFQHWGPAGMACSEADVIAAGITRAVARRIVEQPHTFAPGTAGDPARAAAASAFEAVAHSDELPVCHFMPKPGAAQVPDNIADVRTYAGITRTS